MPLVALGIGSIVGSVAGGAIAAHGATSAANAQVSAADRAAALQAAEADKSLQFQKDQFNTGQKELAPFLNAGYGGLANLQSLLGIPFSGGGATTPGIPSFSGVGATAQVPLDSLAKYQGQDFSSLTNSGDPNISPNAQTTQAWQQAGIPFKNITTSDGRQVAVRDTSTSSLSSPSANGINVPSSTTDLSSLVNPSLGSFGSLLQPFQAPSALDETNDPGYKARLALGQQALENSAAAKGGLLSGGTAKTLTQFGQDYGSNEYQNVYSRAFNTFSSNQTNLFNRLASIAGIGQQATNTSINAGQNAANNATNINLLTGQNIGSNINTAGSARASGYLNSGNIFGNAVSGIPGQLSQLLLLSKLFPGGSQPSPIQNYDQSVGSWG